MIDTVTNLVEPTRLENITAAHKGLSFEIQWLARYPRPLYCVHDQGTEFTGYQFKHVLTRYNIRPSPSNNR